MKDNIALGLKALSVAIWNNFGYSDYPEYILLKALNIDVTESTKIQLNEAKDALRGLKNKIIAQRLSAISTTSRPISSLPRATTKEKSDNSAVYIIIFIVIGALIVFAATSHKSPDNN